MKKLTYTGSTPGFTMKPEDEHDRRFWRGKPWVSWKSERRPRRYPGFIVLLLPPRKDRSHDPEARQAKQIAKRRLQGKDRR